MIAIQIRTGCPKREAHPSKFLHQRHGLFHGRKCIQDLVPYDLYARRYGIAYTERPLALLETRTVRRHPSGPQVDAFIRITLRIGEINGALVYRELGNDPPSAAMHAAYFMPHGSIEVRGGNYHVVNMFCGRIDRENIINLVARYLEARNNPAA